MGVTLAVKHSNKSVDQTVLRRHPSLPSAGMNRQNRLPIPRRSPKFKSSCGFQEGRPHAAATTQSVGAGGLDDGGLSQQLPQ